MKQVKVNFIAKNRDKQNPIESHIVLPIDDSIAEKEIAQTLRGETTEISIIIRNVAVLMQGDDWARAEITSIEEIS